jgi:anti-sigma factor RsiW
MTEEELSKFRPVGPPADLKRRVFGEIRARRRFRATALSVAAIVAVSAIANVVVQARFEARLPETPKQIPAIFLGAAAGPIEGVEYVPLRHKERS